MRDEQIEEQIERCRRLRKFLTDGEMRDALRELAEDYEARLKQQESEGFMLRDSSPEPGRQ
jgi:hypothetical protein